jgi:hypothetical protein
MKWLNGFRPTREGWDERGPYVDHGGFRYRIPPQYFVPQALQKSRNILLSLKGMYSDPEYRGASLEDVELVLRLVERGIGELETRGDALAPDPTVCPKCGQPYDISMSPDETVIRCAMCDGPSYRVIPHPRGGRTPST